MAKKRPEQPTIFSKMGARREAARTIVSILRAGGPEIEEAATDLFESWIPFDIAADLADELERLERSGQQPREHTVPCQVCRVETWNRNALCDEHSAELAENPCSRSVYVILKELEAEGGPIDDRMADQDRAVEREEQWHSSIGPMRGH